MEHTNSRRFVMVEIRGPGGRIVERREVFGGERLHFTVRDPGEHTLVLNLSYASEDQKQALQRS